MNKLKLSTGLVALVGACLMAQPARAIVPIADVLELPQEIYLAVSQAVQAIDTMEGLVEQTVEHNDLLAGSDFTTGIAAKLDESSKDTAEAINDLVVDNSGSSAVSGNAELKAVSGYLADAQSIEQNLIIDPAKEYTDEALAELKKKQRLAVDAAAKDGVALGAASVNAAAKRLTDSDDKKESSCNGVGGAEDLWGVYQTMTALEAEIYAKSMQTAALDSIGGTVRAMRIVQELGDTETVAEKE